MRYAEILHPMRFQEIIEDAPPTDLRYRRRVGGPPIPPEALAKAKVDGFDTSHIWFHGSLKAIEKFRQPKVSTELGPGIYLADAWRTAYSWAGLSGHVMSCCVRQGDFVDLTSLRADVPPKLFRELHKRHTAMMQAKWGAEEGSEPLKSFKERMNGILRSQETQNKWLNLLGYVGAYDHSSQIIGQIVVFNAKDVRVVVVSPGSADLAGDRHATEIGTPP